jgi:hypothetical protein
MRIVALLTLALIGCEPPNREYPRPVFIVQEEASLPSSVLILPNDTQQDPVPDPPGSVCDCEPLACNGAPIMSGGVGGCTPTLGADDIGSVEIRMPGGETLSVFQGGKLSMYLDAQPQNDWFQATFRGIVSAQRFVEWAPVFISGYYEIGGYDNTIMVDPQSDTSVIKLPVAMYHAGRIVRVKVIGVGAVDIKPSVNGFTGLLDEIEGSPAGYSMQSFGYPMPSVELQAYYSDPQASVNVPHKTGWAIVASHALPSNP